jgi:hypothetical protein
MFEKKRGYNEAEYQLYVDFGKAYDSVRKEVLYYILTEGLYPHETGEADKNVPD